MQKSFAGAAATAHLSAALTGTPTTFTTDTSAGWPNGSPGPFVAVIDRTTATEEKVLCSALSGTTFTIETRGWDGTAVSNHSAGAVVEHVVDADTLQEANSHVNNTTRDDHTQYYNQARHDAHVHPLSVIPTITRSQTDDTVGTLVGEMKMGAWAAAPTGWLLCDGSAYSRTSYATLFSAIGTTWGAGDGSTTFNVPDMRSRVPVGAGSNASAGLTPRALAAVGGEESHTLVKAEMPSHTHTDTTGHSHPDPGHSHGNTTTESAQHTHGPGTGSSFITGGSGAGALGPGGATVTASGATGVESVSHVHGINAATTNLGSAEITNLNTTGNDAAHNNMQPWAAVTYIIKYR